MPKSTSNLDYVMEVHEDFVDTAVQALVVELQGSLHKVTPKDTGFAASNWLASLESPMLRTYGSKETATHANTHQDQVARVAAKFRHEQHRRIYLSNHVPYITLLNDGRQPTSKASPGFVQAAIRQTVNRIAVVMRSYKARKIKA